MIIVSGVMYWNYSKDYSHVIKENWNISIPSDSDYSEVYRKDSESSFIVQKREGKGIWENLYEFPVFETESQLSENEIVEEVSKMEFFSLKPVEVISLHNDVKLHKLSHQHLNIRFFEVQFDSKLPDSKPITEIEKLPFPIVIHNFIVANYCNSL